MLHLLNLLQFLSFDGKDFCVFIIFLIENKALLVDELVARLDLFVVLLDSFSCFLALLILNRLHFFHVGDEANFISFQHIDSRSLLSDLVLGFRQFLILVPEAIKFGLQEVRLLVFNQFAVAIGDLLNFD